jgi:hypothetical protein
MENTEINLEKKESSVAWDSNKGTGSEAPCGAAELNPVKQTSGGTSLTEKESLSIEDQTSEILECLAENVCTLCLRTTRKNRCGAAKKQATRARLAGTTTADSGGRQSRSAPMDRPQTQQKPGTSGALHGKAPAPAKLTSPDGGEHLRGPSKRQQSAGDTPEDGQSKESKTIGQPSYTRVSNEGHRVAVICDDYPKSSVSRETFLDIQRAIGRFVDELPEDGFTPRVVDSYSTKGAAVMVCHDVTTRDWLTSNVPTLEAWEGSRLKVMGLDSLPPSRGWWPGFRAPWKTRSGIFCGFVD